MTWDTVIGLEVHTQLATQSKIFSSAPTAYGAEPNTQACLVDLGYPGVLPVLNKQVLSLAIRFGLAVDGDIDRASRMARKNYFYPDLPKGYQISQSDQPIVNHGTLAINTTQGIKTIRILRAHLEEDAGKSNHGVRPGQSGMDFNRAGTPLLEIVTEPDFSNADEVVTYLKKLHHLVRYLGISDANMEEGSFRCDVNISLKPAGSDTLGTRAELKNLNSFKFIESAIAYEIERQADILESGGKVTQETRLYDPDKDETRSMRGKEDAHDYRYFPDPDLLPIVVTDAMIDAERDAMPELPWDRCERLQKEYQLPQDAAEQLIRHSKRADLFDAIIKAAPSLPGKLIANWINGEIKALLQRQESSFDTLPLSTDTLAELLSLLASDTVSSSGAKTLLDALWNSDSTPTELMNKLGLAQLSDDNELQSIIQGIIDANPEQAEDFRAGKTKLMAFFVGKIMKATQGSANPKRATELIKKALTNKS